MANRLKPRPPFFHFVTLALALVPTVAAPSSAQQAKRIITLNRSTDQGRWGTFGRDKKLVAAAECDDGLIKLWDVATGDLKTQIQDTTINSITQGVFSPDGQLLAMPTDAGRGVRIWDLSTTTIKTTLMGQADGVLAIAFSPDGKRLATGNTNDTVSLWELPSGLERTLGGHSSTVFAVAFSQDGKLLASGSRDCTVKLWDVAAGAQIASLTGHGGAVRSVLFSSDGRFLVAARSDVNKVSEPENAAPALAVKIWDLARREEKANLRGCAWPVFSDNGKLLATLTDAGGAVQVWDTASAKQKFSYKLSPNMIGVAVTFQDDRNLLALVKHNARMKLLPISMAQGSQKQQ